MKIELHIIQNFAFSCLNRDDTNSPKDCEFGGVRRARISSQCIKRSIRTDPSFMAFHRNTGIRTKLLFNLLHERLLEDGFDEEDINLVVPAFIECYSGIDKKRTKVLLYLGTDEIDGMCGILKENWKEALNNLKKLNDKEKKSKKERKAALDGIFKKVIKECRGGTKAADIALFGRMIAEAPTENIDAACQVAHAISTHRIKMEMDFYTAVDDLLPEEETGAGMMGTIEFNSACFYRYSLLDIDQLVKNLKGDRELALMTVEGFLSASIAAVPSGKQSSTAAYNHPSLVMVVIRSSGAPQSLVNAFEKPITPNLMKGQSLVDNSIYAVDGYWGKFTKMYGTEGIKSYYVAVMNDVDLVHLSDRVVESIDDLIVHIREDLK